MSSNTVLFWLLILVEPVGYIVILTIGIIFAWLAFLFFNPHFMFNFEKWWGTAAQFIASFIVVAFFTQKKQSVDEKKLQAMQGLAGTLAHEIRTPLAGIQANVEAILPYWSTLIHAYQRAREMGATLTHIRPAQLRLLETALDRMQREIELAQNTISMLLMNVTLGRIHSENHTLCSISQCVEQALTRYPFESNQLTLIHWDKTNDFVFKGNELLIVHVLFNLLKNAFYHIKATNQGNIHVWFDTTNEHHQLHFRDTAKGISPQLLPHIFECFISKTYHGSGIGLTFCKAAMESMGGSMLCESIEGEYAEFILRFPKSI